MPGGELLFGQIALQNGVISGADLSRALTTQSRLSQEGKRVHLGQVLVDLGLLTPAQVNQILALQKFVTLREEDKSFGRLAVINGFLTEAQLQTCLDQQKLAWKGSRRVERIGEIMVRLGMISEQQRDALLERQLRLKTAEATVVMPEGLAGSKGDGGAVRSVEVIVHATRSTPGAAGKGADAPAEARNAAAREAPSAATRPALPSVPEAPADPRPTPRVNSGAGTGPPAWAPSAAAATRPAAGGGGEDPDDGPLICLRTCPFCQATTDGDRVRCIVCGRRSCVYCGMIAAEEDEECGDCRAQLSDDSR